MLINNINKSFSTLRFILVTICRSLFKRTGHCSDCVESYRNSFKLHAILNRKQMLARAKWKKISIGAYDVALAAVC